MGGFFSDNGNGYSGSNLPLRGRKGTLFEGAIHGVGFVSGGLVRKQKGTINNNLIHISDWFPTLIHLGGGNTDDLDLDGYDIWHSIRWVIM